MGSKIKLIGFLFHPSRGEPSATAAASMLPGGEREQVFDSRNTTRAPSIVRENQLQCTSEHYKARVLADGIPPRAAGLFPPGDAVLQSLALNPRLHAFEKHLPGASSSCESLPKGGWATGDAAAARGLDLRLFYKARAGRAGREHWRGGRRGVEHCWPSCHGNSWLHGLS